MAEKSPIDHIIELKEQVGGLQVAVENSEKERREERTFQKQITDALDELKRRMNAMPDEQHKEHHDFINTLIAESEQRQKIRQAIYEKIASGGAWALLAGIFLLMWIGVKAKFGIGSNG